MILQEVLTSQHAAKRKSTLLVWPLVTGRTWNGRALKGKRTPCLKAVIGCCMYSECFLSENCQGLSTKKDAQKYPKRSNRKTFICHRGLYTLLCQVQEWKMLQGSPSNSKSPEEGKSLVC